MALVRCVECEEQGLEFPAAAAAREIHRALHGLGRRFLEVLDPIVAAFVPIKPLADLDAQPPFDLPVVPDLAVPRGELRLMMGGREVGRAKFDGGAMQGEVLDPGAIAQLRAGLLGGMSMATRPEDWAPGARAIIWPEREK